MRITSIKRIATEDFPEDSRPVVEKLAFAINPFLEQISAIFNKNIDFDNLNQEILSTTIEVSASGVPKNQVQVKTSLKTRIKGMQCIRANNLENDSSYPTGAPFVTFQQSGDLLTIQHVTGIPADKRYSLTIVVIG